MSARFDVALEHDLGPRRLEADGDLVALNRDNLADAKRRMSDRAPGFSPFNGAELGRDVVGPDDFGFFRFAI